MSEPNLNPQKYEQNTNGNFLFIRHGQTICNSDKDLKGRKFNPNYIDSHLSEKGINQSKNLKEKIEKFDIEAIYVSPLYRSLETAKYMIENMDYKGEIIVHPLIIECLNCIDDIIFDVRQTKKDFQDLNVNWNIFDEYVKKYKKWDENFYYFEYFNRLNEEEKNIKYNKLLNLYKNGDMIEFKQGIVNEIQRKVFNEDLSINPFESFKLVYSRFLEFKNFLSTKHKAINQNDSNKKIIVITHSNFLGVITNKYLYDNDNINYFPKECCHCKNCDIISIYI
jgi:broad specificity phosphatase PhoE